MSIVRNSQSYAATSNLIRNDSETQKDDDQKVTASFSLVAISCISGSGLALLKLAPGKDFLKLASSKNGLIYPVEEERRTLGQDRDATLGTRMRIRLVLSFGRESHKL